jgi:hypothetical protein
MLAWTRTAVALLAFWFVGLGAAQGAWRAVEGIDVATGKPSLLLIGDQADYGREKPGYITTTWLTRETISAVVAELAEVARFI